MKLTFRTTLLSILVSLLLATVAVLGGASYFNIRFAAQDLADQILDQTSLRIEEEIDQLLDNAIKPSQLSLKRFNAGHARPNDFVSLIRDWELVIDVHPQLSALFIGLESDGTSAGVSRLNPAGPTVWESGKNLATGLFEIKEYWLADFPEKPFESSFTKTAPDMRTRPWYELARRLARPAWTETFVFLGVKGRPNVVGVSYATPVYDTGGSLTAVIDADFNLSDLCKFMQTLAVGRDGFAFVLETRADGNAYVIAHPNEKVISQAIRARRGEMVLTPVASFADPRVTEFLSAGGITDGDEVTRFTLDGESFLGNQRQLDDPDLPHWTICSIIPEQDILARVNQNTALALFVGVLGAAGAVAVSLYISSQVAGPLENLAKAAERIGRLQVGAEPVRHSVVLEVDRLAVAVEDMKTGLRSFQKYVPADVVRGLVETRSEAQFGGQRRCVTTLFCDIVDFTAHSERLSPEHLVDHLREYLTALTEEVMAAGGAVDKYIGDAVMAFWGAPADDASHAAAACQAALNIQDRLVALREKWHGEGRTPFYSRIGINTGDVIAGNIGSDARLNYTVIGDAVNLASRLEGINKLYGTEAIISESTYFAAMPFISARPLDWVAVKGKTEPVLVYELLGRGGEGVSTPEWVDLYADALQSYRDRRWDEALAQLALVLEQRPGDPPSIRLRELCRDYAAAPPAENWDGVYRALKK